MKGMDPGSMKGMDMKGMDPGSMKGMDMDENIMTTPEKTDNEQGGDQ